MRMTLFMLTLFATLSPSAVGQDTTKAWPPPYATVGDHPQGTPSQPGVASATRRGNHHPPYPPFCVPGSCLYYAGDYDSADPNANGLYNADAPYGTGQVWVGVKPDRDVTVTGATFVQALNSNQLVNPTPFSVQVGTKLGQPGKTICNTSSNATLREYEYSDVWPQYSVTIARIVKPCRLKKGHVYYVNLLPTFDFGSGGGLSNVEDAKPRNHYGWKNDLNDCYFNSPTFGDEYVTCNSQGSGNHGFSEFSIALTGKE